MNDQTTPHTPATRIEQGALRGPVHMVVSPFKTGTSSVGQALIDLGIGQRDMPYAHHALREWRPVFRPLNKLADKADGFNDFNTLHGKRVREEMAAFLDIVQPFDVFHDAPFGHTHIHLFIRKILAPDACFIWVNRPFEEWITSVRKWEITHPEVYPRHTEWTTEPKKRRTRKHQQWQTAYKTFKKIQKSFPKQCLEMQWTDLNNYKKIAQFYKIKPPQKPFPKINVNNL